MGGEGHWRNTSTWPLSVALDPLGFVHDYNDQRLCPNHPAWADEYERTRFRNWGRVERRPSAARLASPRESDRASYRLVGRSEVSDMTWYMAT